MKSSGQYKLIFKNGLAFGHIVECFNNTIYGYFAVFLAPIFFPTQNSKIHALAAFGTFAAGFVARPLGALFFGFIGDSKNRKQSLVYSLTLVGIPVLIIGLLPSYKSIGVAAPIILILCRALQGFLFGGEFAGANLFIYENVEKKHHGTYTGILLATGILGAMFSALSGAVMTNSSMPEWAWRVPFIMGGIFALLSCFFRNKLNFKKSPTNLHYNWGTILSLLFKNHKLHFLMSVLLSGLTVVPLYLATIYANQVFREIGLTSSHSMLLNAVALLTDAAFIIICGKIADKVGFHKMITIGCICNIIVAIPSFYFLYFLSDQFSATICFVLLLVASGCIINGCTMPYIAHLYPHEIRYTSVAVSHSIGISFIGGTTPLIATLFSKWFNSNLAPSIFLILLSTIILVIHNQFFFKKNQLNP